MGWFDLGKRIAEKKLAERQAAAQEKAVAGLEQQDEGLPLGLKIGGVFEVPRAVFAVLQGSLVVTPPGAQMAVVSVSRLKLEADPGAPIYRFYTNLGQGRLGQGEHFLQVFGKAGEIQEIGYYQFLHRFIPESEEDQLPYMGEGYGLGEIDFYLSGEQLEAAGVPAARIAEALAGEDALHYTRDVPGGAYVAPFVGVETRVDDHAGISGLAQTVRFMPYVRTLPDGNEERLLISFEVVESVDGSDKPQVHVDFMLGITLDPLKVKAF